MCLATTRIRMMFAGCQEDLFKMAVPIQAMLAFRKLFCFYRLILMQSHFLQDTDSPQPIRRKFRIFLVRAWKKYQLGSGGKVVIFLYVHTLKLVTVSLKFQALAVVSVGLKSREKGDAIMGCSNTTSSAIKLAGLTPSTMFVLRVKFWS